MKKSTWLSQFNEHKDILRSFVRNYHPAIPHNAAETPMKITASGAEAACDIVRTLIQRETKEDPMLLFDLAVAQGNTSVLNSLLNAAWFGVPESTSCWSIEGFKEAVNLLEDPPE